MPHARPQAPQWEGLLRRSTQLPLQLVSIPSHMVVTVMQVPITQFWLMPHARPQAPQLDGSMLVLTQEGPQRVNPDSH